MSFGDFVWLLLFTIACLVGGMFFLFGKAWPTLGAILGLLAICGALRLVWEVLAFVGQAFA